MSARTPDFFILGAPKCGTTSLYRYLSANPRLFLSPEKEPRHFCSDLPFSVIEERTAYLRLFERTPVGMPAGEASPWYLYSKKAVPEILRFNPDARFVVLARDPVELAASLHQHHRRAGIEPAASFEQAWREQDGRHLSELWAELRQNAERASVPGAAAGADGVLGRGPAPLLPRFPYLDACRLGAQLERLLALVPRERVAVLLLDDLAADPRGAVEKVSALLGVPPVAPPAFEAHNAARANRSTALAKAWYAATRRTPLYWRAKRVVNRMGFRPGRFLFDNVATKRAPPSRPPPRLEAEMRRAFADDVALLGSLIGRDLSPWLPRGR